jgi:amidohydrolase
VTTSSIKPIDAFLPDLIALRHRLHSQPELSGAESHTAELLTDYLARFEPDALISGLGGHGLAAVFDGAADGPTLLLRADLDALPIQESNPLAYRSRSDGVAHKCGHDGHMAMLAGVAASLASTRPKRGRVVLLFQPAEETGVGARAVIADDAFAALQPDLCFALHNVPGAPLGQVQARAGVMTCASRGACIKLVGKSSHAAHPEAGHSPGPAVARLIEGLPRLALKVDGFALVSLVHARLGEPGYGTMPGDAEVLATLRSDSDADMDRLIRLLGVLVRASADQAGVGYELSWCDVFRAGENDAGAVALLQRAAADCGADWQVLASPMRWSEDFAEFTARWPGALFGLGSGEQCPQLHTPDYDFPDALIPRGAGLFCRLIERYLG